MDKKRGVQKRNPSKNKGSSLKSLETSERRSYYCLRLYMLHRDEITPNIKPRITSHVRTFKF
jgi:hypothetical protein